MTKKEDAARWEALERDAVDADVEEFLAMSPEARRREVAAAGFDEKRLDAEVAALRGEQATPGQVVALRPRRARIAAWVAGATALAAGGSVVAYQFLGHPTRARPPEAPRAEVLRDAARSACGARRWAECLDDLDRARAIDPEGDRAPDVEAMRRQATHPE